MVDVFAPNAVAESNWVAYQRARDSGHEKWLETAKKCDDFYLGEQWDDRDKSKLDAEGRPALTINEILKVVNAFLGKQATQRADIIFKPRRDASSDTAEILRLVTDQILDHNMFEYLEKDVFEDGIVIDRGYFDIRMDFSDNILGDIKLRAPDPYEVMPDPDAKSYDPEGWNQVILTKWMTLDDIEAHYGKKKRQEVEASVLSAHSFGEDSVRYEGKRTFGEDDFGFREETSHLESDQNIRAVRVIERQYRKMAPMRYFVDNIMGDMSPIADDIDDDRARQIAQASGLSIMRKVSKRIRWTATVDNVVLHDEWSPYRSFTVIPYFPFFRKGRTSGVVRQLLSPQEQFNKMESQMLHIVNTTANSGWKVEDGSLTNMTIEELEERGAETGLVLSYRKGAQEPEKIDANKIPTGLDRLATRAQANVAGIAGVDGLVKSPEREVSGVALDQLEARGLIQVDVPFDSLKRTRTMVARKVLELIQDFYTETRIIRVSVGNGFDSDDRDIVINGVNAVGEVINDLTIGEYDIVVGSRPTRDNFEDSQFATALQLRKAGVLIPDDVVIRNSPLDDKDAIADRVASLQGVAPPTPQEIQQAQLEMRMEMRFRELELDKMAAEVRELQARAMQQFAKAQQLEGEAQAKAIEIGMGIRQQAAELQAKMQMFYDELNNKLQLAGIHSRSSEQQVALQEATKHSMKELDVIAKLAAPPKPTTGK